jgi:hypothetical protein
MRSARSGDWRIAFRRGQIFGRGSFGTAGHLARGTTSAAGRLAGGRLVLPDTWQWVRLGLAQSWHWVRVDFLRANHKHAQLCRDNRGPVCFS